MDPLISISLTALCVGIAMGIFGTIMARQVVRAGKVRLLLIDPDGGPLSEHYLKPNGNEVSLGRGDNARTFLLDGEGRIPGKNATYLAHPRHGWIYTLSHLRDSETVDKDAFLMRLSVSNPKSYHLAIARNKVRDALNANQEDDKWGWVAPVAMIGGVVLIAILGLLGYVVYRISSAASAVPGAGV